MNIIIGALLLTYGVFFLFLLGCLIVIVLYVKGETR